MKTILIVGASGQGKVAFDIIRCLKGKYKPVGWLDDNPEFQGKKICGLPVLGGTADLKSMKAKARTVVIGIGNNEIRARLFNEARAAGYELPSLIHPSAVIAPDVEIGPGAQISPGVVIVIGTRLAEDVIVNTSASIDHECRVGAHAYIAPGARVAGNVDVGAGVWVGINSCILQGLKIGDRAVIGAGAAILRDVEPKAVMVGVPGKLLRYQK